MAPVLADAPASRGRRWGDLRLRVISASILIPLALFCVWAGGAAFLLLVAVATAGLVWEWIQLWRGVGAGRTAPGQPARPAAPNPLPQRERGIGVLVAGLGAILAAAFCLAWLRGDPLAGLYNLLFLLILVWSSDSGAYAVGRMFGGPKLAPRISPGKTISGAVGGLVAAVLAGLCVALAVPRPTSLLHAVIAAVVLGMVAQAGDLLESYVKRQFGAKDSGRLIPGHGGLLDRLDALLAVALAGALLALGHGRGVVLWG